MYFNENVKNMRKKKFPAESVQMLFILKIHFITVCSLFNAFEVDFFTRQICIKNEGIF
jgi:hypothetical protein